MKHKSLPWTILLTVGLLGTSVCAYALHALLFHDVYHIVYYLLLDIAFIPINILLVTLIISRLFDAHDHKKVQNKLNMVIGVFFSEIGSTLLASLKEFDPQSELISVKLADQKFWQDNDVKAIKSIIRANDLMLRGSNLEIDSLHKLLIQKKYFLLGLLENQNLLEHDVFTDLLWAVFHLAEELALHNTIDNTTKADKQHLVVDMQRVYSLLILQWVAYMKYLQENYPYLFSMAVRTNPFNPKNIIIPEAVKV